MKQTLWTCDEPGCGATSTLPWRTLSSRQHGWSSWFESAGGRGSGRKRHCCGRHHSPPKEKP